ncbi:MAG: DUF86 domain-containing protein [Deltaproteobacteria bacterium]|nr:DUF86 domain-containing protein [Deltaproteobacteria bacterium]
MVNVLIVRRLLNNLEGYVSELRNATDITHEKYLNDIRLQRFVERTLQIAIECCFDVVHHIISDEGYREPDSYADAFVVLAEQGVLTQKSMGDYQLMAQFRNKIVHYYEKIDPEQVYAIFKGKLNSFNSFKNQIEQWIDLNTEQNPI